MKPEPEVLQRKIIGVLLRAAREKARRTVKEVAHRLNVPPARIRAYERGTREISLPELEVLALYLQTPLSFFFNEDAPIEASNPEPVRLEEMRVRRAMIGTKLKQARLADGKSREECARAIGCTTAMLRRYETGAVDIPITTLDALARFLHVSLYYFVERKTPSPQATELMDMERLASLPKEVRAFVLDPNNLPYLRMAMKFADMPTDRLKELGEILLVVR